MHIEVEVSKLQAYQIQIPPEKVGCTAIDRQEAVDLMKRIEKESAFLADKWRDIARTQSATISCQAQLIGDLFDRILELEGYSD